MPSNWRLDTITLWALLLLPLTLSPLLGLMTPYVALVILLVLFVVTLVRRQGSAAYGDYTAVVLLGVFVLQAILFAVTADAVSDGLKAFNFTMLAMYGIAWLFFARHPSDRALERVAQLATVGVVLALLLVAISALHSHRPRPPNIGPIVISNGILALGFLASGMALMSRDRRSWLYLLVPLVAVVTTVLTGSRGPLLALPVAFIVAASFFWRYRLGATRRSALYIALGLVALGIVGALLLQGRSASLFTALSHVLGGGAADRETEIRLVLYRSGWQSFLQSPWIGHGWGNIMGSIKPFLSEPDQKLARLPQLHNDVLNFAVAGGVIGVACYLAILTAPLIGAIRSGRDSLRPFRLYATTLIMIVYAGGGLTDLMFGFEFHTFLFVMLNAIVLGYCRQAPTNPTG